MPKIAHLFTARICTDYGMTVVQDQHEAGAIARQLLGSTTCDPADGSAWRVGLSTKQASALKAVGRLAIGDGDPGISVRLTPAPYAPHERPMPCLHNAR